MTTQQKEVARITWPLVAMVGLVLFFLFGVFVVIPADEPESRTALLGFLVTTSASVVAIIVQRLSNKVEKIKDQTNGALSELLQSKTQPDLASDKRQLRALIELYRKMLDEGNSGDRTQP